MFQISLCSCFLLSKSSIKIVSLNEPSSHRLNGNNVPLHVSRNKVSTTMPFISELCRCVHAHGFVFPFLLSSLVFTITFRTVHEIFFPWFLQFTIDDVQGAVRCFPDKNLSLCSSEFSMTLDTGTLIRYPCNERFDLCCEI